MSSNDALAILFQMGYYRPDTVFMSLNLTDMQLLTLQAALEAAGENDVETGLAKICQHFLQGRCFDDGSTRPSQPR